jgi:hypothetical protein
MDQDRQAERMASGELAMVAAVYSVIVWAGMLLVLLCVASLAGHAERATTSAGGWGIWLHLMLLAQAFVIGLIATAVLYSLYFGDIGFYIWSRLHG